MVDHELVCSFAIVICKSPICQKRFTRKDGYGDRTACSSICFDVYQFKLVYDGNNQAEILKAFQHQLDMAKSKVVEELTEKFSEEFKTEKLCDK